MNELNNVLDNLSTEFLDLHTKKEDLFWETKMGLTSDASASQRELSKAEIAVTKFNQNADALRNLRQYNPAQTSDELERTALQGWINFFAANAIEDHRAKKLAEEIIEMEGELQAARNAMQTGFTDPATGKFIPATSTLLGNMLRMETNEGLRKSAFEGMRSIEPYVISHGFLEIVKKRNELGRSLGYEDYYDMKVSKTEGFSKKKLFELLDDLEVKTRSAAKRAIEAFVKTKGETAREPWNYSFFRAGELAAKMDPYFPFEYSLERWVRSFAGLGIKYRNAILTLDLVDRKGKYENGFMHGPVPSFYNHGKWNPARINFTANAMPNKVGAGLQALRTLFHEGGHAAHFSNILMNAPCFGQEFAPTSVAYAETQSMFLDSIISDADWKRMYAKNEHGEPLPMDLIDEAIEQNQSFEAVDVRSMLSVCYVEKALYEMSDTELTPEHVMPAIRKIESEMFFLNASPRPSLAVPHLLAGESSAYYHGYVMAEMAVHQTRKYFLDKYGYITDNPHVGPELAEGYWASGNSVGFLTLVERVTKKPFSADALVESCNKTVEQATREAHDLAKNAAKRPAYSGPLDLDAKVRIVHGNDTITEFENGSFDTANAAFTKWVRDRFPKD